MLSKIKDGFVNAVSNGAAIVVIAVALAVGALGEQVRPAERITDAFRGANAPQVAFNPCNTGWQYNSGPSEDGHGFAATCTLVGSTGAVGDWIVVLDSNYRFNNGVRIGGGYTTNPAEVPRW